MTHSDKNPEIKFSTPILEGSAPYGYMYAIQKGQLVTLEEMIIINRILIGCSKLVVSSYVAGARKRARALSKPTTKRLVSITSILKLNRTDKYENKNFRPSDLRRQLPDEIKNVQAADLTDTLRYLSNLNMVTKTKRDRGKRGAPPRSSKKDLSQPGRQSFYQQTEYIKKLKQTVAKSIVRKLLFSFLLESNLIHKWLEFQCLLAFYLLKFNDINTIRKIGKAVNIIGEESKNENLYRNVNQYDDRKLKRLANRQAILILKRFKEHEELFTSLYINGGLYFNA